MLRVGCLKGFADGSLGSTTAWFFEPYLDAPNTSGLPREAVTTTMKQDIVDADKAGLQVHIHAIGDRANATILDFYENVNSVDGPRDRRFRIEHAQHLRQEDIPRFGKLKVVASMQPMHIIDDGRWAGKRLDEKRLKGTYAFRSLLDSGAVLAFGSDSPVATMDALTAFMQPSPVEHWTTRTRTAGYRSKRSRSRKLSAHSRGAQPTPNSRKT